MRLRFLAIQQASKTWPTVTRRFFNNTSGSENTANGAFALYYNTTGHDNAANGQAALVNNTTGNDNTADGVTALDNNTTGNNNIALGSTAGFNLTTGDYNIDIGNNGIAGEAFTIRIGDVERRRAPLSPALVGPPVTGTGVVVDSTVSLAWPLPRSVSRTRSSRWTKRAKRSLRSNQSPSDTRKNLIPRVSRSSASWPRRWKRSIPIWWLAMTEGKPYTVRYEAVNAMLLNEFLKEHRKVEQLTKDFESKACCAAEAN